MHIIMLALILAAIIITINAIYRGSKRKKEEEGEEEAFKRLLEKHRELDEMEARIRVHEERLKAIKIRMPSDNDDPEATIGKRLN